MITPKTSKTTVLCRAIAATLIATATLAAASPATFAPRPAPPPQNAEEDRLVTILVIDEITGQPLPGWSVIIGPRGPYDFWFTGMTGNSGTAQFVLPDGDYRAWVTRGGPQVWGASFTTSGDHTRVVVAVNPYEN